MDGDTGFVVSREIGRIASVTGSEVVVVFDPRHRGRDDNQLATVVKGTLVKIHTKTAWIYGLVTAVSIPLPSREDTETEIHFAELLLLGECSLGETDQVVGPFERGISSFPAVGQGVYPTTTDDIAVVYAKKSPAAVRIGAIHQDRSMAAHISPDLLLGKHFAVLGTTGSGKSCATALILRRIIESHPNAHIVVLDPHNEYSDAFRDYAEIIDSKTLELPYWLFSFEELCAAILGDVTEDPELQEQASILLNMVVRAKIMFQGNHERSDHLTANTPVPYKMSDLLTLLDIEMGSLNQNKRVAPIVQLQSKINSLKNDSRYQFMFGGISLYDNMIKIISRIFRLPVQGKPITILDLSAVPSDILNIVVSVLCRITFDLALYSDRQLPILLVCEEAHRYLPEDTRQGFEPTKRILARIAKEGRKYGVALGIISQRPSDLAISALSQCNTVFALRLTNQTDQNFVRAMLPDWGGGLFDFLPSLRNGEAIVVGDGISVPARVRFDQLPVEHLPHGTTAPFSKVWQQELGGQDVLEEVVHRWRAER